MSGSGTNLQALIDACVDDSFGAHIAAVGADRPGIAALERAEHAGIETFIEVDSDYEDRASWDTALAAQVASYDPTLVVLAGFMKLVGPAFLAMFGGRTLNTHPALSPSFPGMNAPRDALAYGVKITGATLFVVDDGIDTGQIVAQTAVPVIEDDNVTSLHERIKVAERAMLVEQVGQMVRTGLSLHNTTVRSGQQEGV